MFGYFKRKKAEQRMVLYDELNKKIREKHSIICVYNRNKFYPNGTYVNTYAGKEYEQRMWYFFTGKYGKLPKSFDPLSSVSYGVANFDPTPIEKLQELYDEMEVYLPEAFIQINRNNLIDDILFQ